MASSTSELPALTPGEIQKLTDAGSFKRGQGYHRRGMICRPVRRGAMLAASCRGSSGGPYEVRATLATSGRTKLADARCTCPVGGYCKHVVALLLTWSDTPEAFEERPAVDELLAGQEREQLIAIIQTILDLEPRFEAAIEKLTATTSVAAAIPPARPGDAARVTAPIKQVRSRLNAAVDASFDSEDGYGWYDHDWREPRTALELFLDEEESIGDPDAVFVDTMETAVRYENAGRFADAAAISIALADVAMERIDDYDTNAVNEQIKAAGSMLVRCLSRQPDLPADHRLPEALHAELLDVIYRLWLLIGHRHWGQENDVADRALIEELNRPLLALAPDPTDPVIRALPTAERMTLDRRWRVDAANTVVADWRRRSAISFGVTLHSPDGLSEPELLQLLAGAELWPEQADYLLRLGRTNEAAKLAARRLLDPSTALAFADSLTKIEPGGVERAIRFVDERLWETEGRQPSDDVRLLNWLAATYTAQDRIDDAIGVRMRLFKINPDIPAFHGLEKAARSSGVDPAHWELMRSNAMKIMADKGNQILVVQMLIKEGKIRDAIELVDHQQEPVLTGWWSAGTGHYREKVASAAAAEFPDDAIRIYRTFVDALIARRQRNSYTQAGLYLIEIRQVLGMHGRMTEWTAYFDDLIKQHIRLNALHDALTKLELP